MSKNNNIDLWRVFQIVAIFSLVLIYLIRWGRMISTPIERTGADFIAFYAAGRIADNEGAAHVYQLPLQQKYQQEVVGYNFDLQEVNPFVHPPFVIPFTQISVTSNYITSFQRWALLMILISGLGIPLLISTLNVFLQPPEKISFALGMFLFFPLFLSIILGQDNALAFLGAALWMWGLFQKKDWAAGAGLALTTVRPHFALFLLLPFLFKRRAVLYWFMLGVFVLLLISFAYAGLDGIQGFLRILTVSGSGENFKINETDMINFIGLERRIAPNFSPVYLRGIGWLLYALAFLLSGIYHWRTRGDIEARDISTATIVGLFFSPHTHLQDLIMLIIPIMVLVLVLMEKQLLPAKRVVLLPLVVSLILLFSYSSPILMHSIPYILMFGLLLAIWYSQKDSTVVKPHEI